MKNYLSQAWFNQLNDERENLLKEERPKVCETVTWAASLGDRSENADYQYGKKRLREIDRRVRFLNRRLSDYEIVEIVKQDGHKINFGATVTLSGVDNQQKVFTILGPDEIDIEKGRISFNSPIGKALLGKTLGDEVEVKTPSGVLEFEIEQIKYKEIS